MPKVSVIVPLYRAEAYIEQCLASLLTQTLDDMEFILIDDASPDRTYEISIAVIRQFPCRHSQIRFFRNEINQGIASVRTMGLRVATGDFIGWCDSDDWVEPCMFEQMYQTALHHQADMVSCCVLTFDASGHELLHECCYSEQGIEFVERLYQRPRANSVLWNKLIRRSLVIDHELYPYPGIDIGEDFNFLLRYFYFADKVVSLPDAFYHHRVDNPHCISSIQDRQFRWSQAKRNIDANSHFLETVDRQRFKLSCSFIQFTDKLQFLDILPLSVESYRLYSSSYRDCLFFKAYPLQVRLKWLFIFFCYPTYYFYMKYLFHRHCAKSN